VVVGGRGALCAGAVVEPLDMLAFILVVWRKVCDVPTPRLSSDDDQGVCPFAYSIRGFEGADCAGTLVLILEKVFQEVDRKRNGY